MPGICGIVGPGCENIRGMLDRMRHHAWYTERSHCDETNGIALGRISLGIVNTGAQPAASSDGTFSAVMEGELYDVADLRRELEIREDEGESDNHLDTFLRGWRSHGDSFLRRVNGSFVVAIWNHQNRHLSIITDRFATKPIYFARPERRFVFGSSITSIMVDPGVSRAISPRGLSQLFTFGQCLADDTLYESVRVVPAATSLTYDANHDVVELNRYWSTTEAGPSLAAREFDQLEQIDAAFKAAVDRRTLSTENLGIALSGGLDARTILGVIDHRHVKLKTVCLGMVGSRDHRSSQELANIVKCAHHNHVLDDRFLAHFETHLRNMVRLTDGHYPSLCIIMPTLPVYRQLGIRVLLRGHGGELLHMQKAYNYSLDEEGLRMRSDAQLESWLSKRLPAYMLDGVDGPLFAHSWDADRVGLVRESLRECLRPLTQVDSPLQRVWHLFVHQRLRRETMMSMVKFNSVVEPRLPFLDHDFVSLVLALSPKLKLDETIQDHILRKRCPEFLNVSNTNTGTIVGANRARRMFASLRMKVLSKLRVPGYQPYERMGLWLRQELAPLVKGILLSDRSLDRGVFNPGGLKAIVANHLANRRNHTFLLLTLMTFELGQQLIEDEMGVWNELSVNR
jgi:asparagine synthase (glutamine-hydrolysing)